MRQRFVVGRSGWGRGAGLGFAALCLGFWSLGLWGWGGPAAQARVFFSIEEGLQQAFPEATRFSSRTFIPTPEQQAALEKRAAAAFSRQLLKVWMAHAGERLLGYASIDIHTVRTLPEAVLIALTPQGSVRTVIILAFHEPSEYQPPGRWLELFQEKRLAPTLAFGRDIAGITGSTLSSRAITSSVRRALAVYEVFLRGS
ncbi:MAG: FMN-binding protein [Candidatus Tectomicrobia bacterium]|nr:FMN-binding protein [Candidatus Tectomicrobia bacterium]